MVKFILLLVLAMAFAKGPPPSDSPSARKKIAGDPREAEDLYLKAKKARMNGEDMDFIEGLERAIEVYGEKPPMEWMLSLSSAYWKAGEHEKSKALAHQAEEQLISDWPPKILFSCQAHPLTAGLKTFCARIKVRPGGDTKQVPLPKELYRELKPAIGQTIMIYSSGSAKKVKIEAPKVMRSEDDCHIYINALGVDGGWVAVPSKAGAVFKSKLVELTEWTQNSELPPSVKKWLKPIVGSKEFGFITYWKTDRKDARYVVNAAVDQKSSVAVFMDSGQILDLTSELQENIGMRALVNGVYDINNDGRLELSVSNDVDELGKGVGLYQLADGKVSALAKAGCPGYTGKF